MSKRPDTFMPGHDTGESPCALPNCCQGWREYVCAEAKLKEFQAYEDMENRDKPHPLLLARMTGDESPLVVEALYLLSLPFELLTLGDLCKILGVPRAVFMSARQQSSTLEAACKFYVAGLAEDEFETGKRKMAATVLSLALERTNPTFAKVPDESMTAEDVTLLVRDIVDGIRAHVTSLALGPDGELAFLRGINETIIHALARRLGEQE